MGLANGDVDAAAQALLVADVQDHRLDVVDQAQPGGADAAVGLSSSPRHAASSMSWLGGGVVPRAVGAYRTARST